MRRHYPTGRHRARSRPTVTCLAITVAAGGLGGLGYHRALAATVVGLALPPGLETVWCALYALGGVLTAFGVLRQHNQAEAAGLCLLASAMAIWAVCVFRVRGFPDGILTASLFAGLCVGCWWRAFLLTSHRPMM